MAIETRWLYTTSNDLPKLCEESKGVCVIPIGCVEKHGLHLPLGADILQASGIAYEASKLETFTVFADYVFGDVPMGAPTYHPGSITIEPELEMELLEVLCEQIARWGYKKILIYNGHGGNSGWLGVFLRKMANKKRNFVAAWSMMPLMAPHKMAEMIIEKGSGCIPELTKEDEELLLKYHEQDMRIGHACFGETADLMGLHPHTVHLERLGIESGRSIHATDYLRDAKISIISGGWDVDYPNAFSGDDPVGCNERIGKAAVRLAAERLAHTVKVFKEDTNVEKWLLDEYQKGW